MNATCLGLLGLLFAGLFASDAEWIAKGKDAAKAGKLDEAVVKIDVAPVEAAALRRRADLVHAHAPGVQVAVAGARREEIAGFVDVFADAPKRSALLVKLGDYVEAVRYRKRPRLYREMIAAARRLLKLNEHKAEGQELAERGKIDAVIETLKAAAAKLLKWDAGQLTYARAGEVRVARQTASRRRRLRSRHVAACSALDVEPLTDEKWNALWPIRVLFRQDFEKDDDWVGTIVTDNTPPGSKRALLGDTTSKWAARRIRVGIYYDNARAATTTWVRFKYFMNRKAPLQVMVFDMTQRDNHATRVREPVVGQWTELTLQITGKWRRKNGSRQTMQAGNSLDDVFFLAGKAKDADFVLIVDDVELLGRD